MQLPGLINPDITSSQSMGHCAMGHVSMIISNRHVKDVFSAGPDSKSDLLCCGVRVLCSCTSRGVDQRLWSYWTFSMLVA